MPKVMVTLTYERTSTHVVEKELNVPKKVLDDESLFEWLDEEDNQKLWDKEQGDEIDEVIELTEADWEMDS